MSGILGMILGVTSSGPFIFNDTISTNQQNYNVRTKAIAAGWNGLNPLIATVTINSGIVLGSSSTSKPAFDTDSGFPATTTITVVNNGYIVGAGGVGGDAGPYTGQGGNGGPAFKAQYAVSITNNNIIGGGGGGGAGGGNYWGGGGGGAGSIVGTGGLGAGGNGNGSPGTLTTGGEGGVYYGGVGGNLGNAGGIAQTINQAGVGGAGGACTIGNSYITWTVVGTRYGALT